MIVEVPPRFQRLVRVSGDARVELHRAELDGRAVALRLVCYSEERRPIVDPKMVMSRTQEIVAGLELSHVAPLLAVEAVPGGLISAEAWAGDRPLVGGSKLTLSELKQALGPVLDDLAKLHGARKWHGGIRPSRLIAGQGGATLVALPWSVALTGMVRELSHELDRRSPERDPYRAPELAELGPKAAGPTLDVYAIAQLVLRNVAGALSPKLKSALAAAADADPARRPSLAALRGALLE